MNRPPDSGIQQSLRVIKLLPSVDLELFLYVVGQRSTGLDAQLPERGIVLLDELVKERRFESVPAIAGRIEKWRRIRAATGRDASVYGATSCNELVNPTVFDQK